MRAFSQKLVPAFPFYGYVFNCADNVTTYMHGRTEVAQSEVTGTSATKLPWALRMINHHEHVDTCMPLGGATRTSAAQRVHRCKAGSGARNPCCWRFTMDEARCPRGFAILYTMSKCRGGRSGQTTALVWITLRPPAQRTIGVATGSPPRSAKSGTITVGALSNVRRLRWLACGERWLGDRQHRLE